MSYVYAIVVFLFVILPSVLYSIVNFILVFILSLPIRLFIGGIRAAFLSDRICIKFLIPVSLLIVLPIVFYFYIWQTLGWIFFSWMLLYFILRRFSGVSKQISQIDQSFKEADRTVRDLQTKPGKKNI